MNTTVKTNLAAAATVIPTAPMGRQIPPSDPATRGRELVQQFAMSFGSQRYAPSMAQPRP
jgi:hypothetical protein